MINENSNIQFDADNIRKAQEESRWQGLYFGGVSFKYQRRVDDLEKASTIAMNYMDVVTTSGPGTGEAADTTKIKRLKKAFGNFPLAIASGITVENVEYYLDYADCFLVATGISRTWAELDEDLVKLLVEKVRSYK